MAKRKVAQWFLAIGALAMVTSCIKPRVTTSTPPTPVKADVLGPVAAPVPKASSGRVLSSKVTKVTVYSDRARVTRRATTRLTSKPTVFAFRKLPGWVDDGSVRVSVTAGRIVGVRVERNFLARATDKKWRKAQEKHRALQSKLAALDDELRVLEAQKQQIERIQAFSLTKINKDTILGDIKVKSYADVLAFVSNSLRATAKARRAAMRQRDNITPEVQASLRTLAELQNLMKLEETTVLVTLQSRHETPTTIELTYMIPGATWEPMHDLRVSTTNAKTAEVISFAVVTQTSGEDWRNAELSFSTQSTVRSVRIPELEALTLGDTHTATRILTSKMSSFFRAQQAFQKQSQLWNKVHQRRSWRARVNFDQVFQSNMRYLQVVQSKTVRIFERLRKRGTTAHFKAHVAPIVRGDGHPVRMRIGYSTLQTTQKIVAVPEQSLNAARTLEMINSTGQPLLPGKVALYQDGAFLGITELDFIALGERFALFFSVADHLKLSRTLDRKHSSLVRRRNRRRNKMHVAFIVTLENLSPKPTDVTLTDRIPVSENKAIRIDRVKISGSVKPDSQGLLHWKLTLKAKEKRQFRIAYQVEYPAELVLETRRQLARPSSSVRNPYRRRPVQRRKYRIGRQLRDLEDLL